VKLNQQQLTDIPITVERALNEDLGDGDLTAGLVPESAVISATIVTRDSAVIAGRPWVDEVFHQLDPRIRIAWHVNDGDLVAANTVLCSLKGPARPMLSGERVALNFLQTLAATATKTAAYVRATEGTACRILDTRKTIPGLRLAQKYAVTCGGGSNHRVGLFDAILIKENHIMSAGSIAAAIASARKLHPEMPVEVEVESIDEVHAALAANAERLLLDNFPLPLLEQAVALNKAVTDRPAELEASGGLTIADIPAVARTGVDYISVGDLTKNIRAIDLSMRFAA